MIYAYIRVSTDRQTVDNQRFEIEQFCRRNHLCIDCYIEETISGTRNYEKRALGGLIQRISADDLILCTELSRLGRSFFMIMEILNICLSKGCKVWTIKDNYRLGEDIQSKVLAFAFGISAEIERNLISQRTKEALARRRAIGVRLGRPGGARNRALNERCACSHDAIADMLALQLPVAEIARRVGVSKNTLYRYLAYTGLKVPTRARSSRWQRGVY